MDLIEASAALPAALRNDFATRLLTVAELHYVAARLQEHSDKD